MEKEDAYNKIHILEMQVSNTKHSQNYMRCHVACNTDVSYLPIINESENYEEADHKNECQCENDKSEKSAYELSKLHLDKEQNEDTIYENSVEEINEDNKFSSNKNIKFELKPCPKTSRYQNEDHSLIKDNQYMMISSNYQDDKYKNFKQLRNSDLFPHGLHSAKTVCDNNYSSSNNCFDIECIIEKYLGPKTNLAKQINHYRTVDNSNSNTYPTSSQPFSCSNKIIGNTERSYQVPRPIIITNKDLNDFNQKCMADPTASYHESKEGSDLRNDNSLIMFGSVNKTNDTPSSQVFINKFCKSGNKFSIFHKPQNKPDSKQKEFIQSLKENLVSTCKAKQTEGLQGTQSTYRETNASKAQNNDEINSLNNLHFHSTIGNYFTEIKKRECLSSNRIPSFENCPKEKSVFEDQINKSRAVYDPETNLFVSSYKGSRKNSSIVSNQTSSFMQEGIKCKEHCHNFL